MKSVDFLRRRDVLVKEVLGGYMLVLCLSLRQERLFLYLEVTRDYMVTATGDSDGFVLLIIVVKEVEHGGRHHDSKVY